MNTQIDWLMALQRFGMKPGLARMHELLARLGSPHGDCNLVLVGGTNGKGSTATFLAGMLTAAGQRTGLFTSPHLTNVMERFVIDGQQLPASELEQAIRQVRPHAEETGATFFEVMVACAWLMFRAHGCDTVILEVGLGGQFDATNAADPCLSIITNVELDHTDVLGTTRREIAADKAHLMRPGRPVLTAATGEALTTLEEHAAGIGAELLRLGHEFSVRVGDSQWSGSNLQVVSGGFDMQVSVPLPGLHQAFNAALAVVAARRLGAGGESIRTGLAASEWPGRLERLQYGGRNWLLDGAHNPAGARSLREAVGKLGARPGVLILGLTDGKDAAGIIRELEQLAPDIIVTKAELSPRAVEPAALLEMLPPLAQPAATPSEAVSRALSITKPAELVVVAGSLYLLGEIRPLLTGQRREDYARWQ